MRARSRRDSARHLRRRSSACDRRGAGCAACDCAPHYAAHRQHACASGSLAAACCTTHVAPHCRVRPRRRLSEPSCGGAQAAAYLAWHPSGAWGSAALDDTMHAYLRSRAQGPCAHDGLSARLIDRAGFPFMFMVGLSAAHLVRVLTGTRRVAFAFLPAASAHRTHA